MIDPQKNSYFLHLRNIINYTQPYNNRFKGRNTVKKQKMIMSLHGGNAFRGKHHTEEAKQKNRLAHLGKKHDEAFCEKNRIRKP